MATEFFSAQGKRLRPDRRARQRLDAARETRRQIELARGRLASIDSALAAAQSSLRWLDQATNAVKTGALDFRDHPLGLANHVAGAADKRAALSRTIEQLEGERKEAAERLAEAEVRAIGSRLSLKD